VSWLDRARQAIGDVAHSASVEAEIIKIQTQLGGLETERERQYAEAGKRARELYRARQVLDEELGVILQRVDDIEAQLEELRGRVEELRGSQRPPSPGQAPEG